MKKQVFGRKFGRTKNERAALLRGLISSMVLNERIKTTEAKAKAIRGEVERLVTKAKNGKKDLVSKSLYPYALDKMFNDISKRFEQRNGGYTRMIKLGQRFGDRASLVYLEWVEGPVATTVDTKEPKKEKKVKKETKKPAAKSTKVKKVQPKKKEAKK
jgi:large subunit ribosomal protein L17